MKKLNLDNNKLTQIVELVDLKRLNILSLANNALTDFPIDIANLPLTV